MKFRKRPVVIDAMQLTLESMEKVVAWCGGRGYETGMVIETLEGEMTASIGDWIIKGVAGEFYPCKPEIFNKTYELAEVF